MANAIVRATYNLSIFEQRLLYCALKKMPKYNPNNPSTSQVEINENTPFYITRDDLIEIGVKPANLARDIRKATAAFWRKNITIDLPTGRVVYPILSLAQFYDPKADAKLREIYPRPEDYDKYIAALRMYNLFDPNEVVDADVIAKVCFSRGMLPFLHQLKENFTSIPTEDVAKFGGFSTFRIFQILMQFIQKNGSGWALVTIEELRKMMDLTQKYRLTADFKKRIIDPAVNDINENTPIKVNYELIKKRGKTWAVKFTYNYQGYTTIKTNEERDPNTLDILDGLTDAERQKVSSEELAIAQEAKLSLLEWKPDATPLHIMNTQKKAVREFRENRQIEQSYQESHQKNKKQKQEQAMANTAEYDKKWAKCVANAQQFCILNKQLLHGLINLFTVQNAFNNQAFGLLTSMAEKYFFDPEFHNNFIVPQDEIIKEVADEPPQPKKTRKPRAKKTTAEEIKQDELFDIF